MDCHIDSIAYDQLIRLETQFYYPLQFITILNDTDSTEDSLSNVIFSVRYNFIDTYEFFRDHLNDKITYMIYEEDFNSCQNVIRWIKESKSNNFLKQRD